MPPKKEESKKGKKESKKLNSVAKVVTNLEPVTGPVYKSLKNKKEKFIKLSSEELFKQINDQRTKIIEVWVDNLVERVVPIINKSISDNIMGPYCVINVKNGVIGNALGKPVDLTRQLNQDIFKDGKKTTYHRNFISLLSNKTNNALKIQVFVTIKPNENDEFTITWTKYQQRAKVYYSDGKLMNFF